MSIKETLLLLAMMVLSGLIGLIQGVNIGSKECDRHHTQSESDNG